MGFDNIDWGPFFHCATVSLAAVPQSKVGESKIWALGTGIDRRCCFFLNLGDYFAMT